MPAKIVGLFNLEAPSGAPVTVEFFENLRDWDTGELFDAWGVFLGDATIPEAKRDTLREILEFVESM